MNEMIEWMKIGAVRSAASKEKVGPVELIASSKVPIVSMCIFKDHLFVATSDAVFERMDDGSFHEVQLIKAALKE